MANKASIWAVIANASFAEIYAISATNEIKLVHHLDFPSGRIKSGDILADKPGRGFSRTGTQRHAYSSETDVHLQELKLFAHQLADFLQKALVEKKFEKLVIIAPPQFFGELRQEFTDQVSKSIYKEFKKDLHSQLSPQDRIDHLSKLLGIKQQAAPRVVR